MSNSICRQIRYPPAAEVLISKHGTSGPVLWGAGVGVGAGTFQGRFCDADAQHHTHLSAVMFIVTWPIFHAQVESQTPPLRNV